MRAVSVVIDGQRYRLRSGTDLDVLRASLLGAVHADGAFVDISLENGVVLGALVTQRTSLLIEIRPHGGVAVTADDDEPDAETLHAFNYDDMDW